MRHGTHSSVATYLIYPTRSITLLLIPRISTVARIFSSWEAHAQSSSCPCGHADQMREFCGTTEPQEHCPWASIMLDLHLIVMVIATSSDWKPSSTAAKSVDLRRLPYNRMERSITGLTGRTSSPCANLACPQSRIVELPLTTLSGMEAGIEKDRHQLLRPERRSS